MSGAVEGVALREALQRIEQCMNQLIPNLSIESRRANTGAIVQAANDFADLREHLTTPPARTYAEGERADLIEAFTEFADKIDRFGFINALDGHATRLRAAIRLLSQGGGK